jgi:hypothetical protein
MRAGAACPHNTVLEARFRYSTRTSRELTFHFIFLGSISSVCATASRARARPEGPSGFAWHVRTAKATLCDCGTGECRFSTPKLQSPGAMATSYPLPPQPEPVGNTHKKRIMRGRFGDWHLSPERQTTPLWRNKPPRYGLGAARRARPCDRQTHHQGDSRRRIGVDLSRLCPRED